MLFLNSSDSVQTPTPPTLMHTVSFRSLKTLSAVFPVSNHFQQKSHQTPSAMLQMTRFPKSLETLIPKSWEFEDVSAVEGLYTSLGLVLISSYNWLIEGPFRSHTQKNRTNSSSPSSASCLKTHVILLLSKVGKLNEE